MTQTMTAQQEIRQLAEAQGWKLSPNDRWYQEFVHEDGRKMTMKFSRTGAVGYLNVRCYRKVQGDETRGEYDELICGEVFESGRRERALRELVATGGARFGHDPEFRERLAQADINRAARQEREAKERAERAAAREAQEAAARADRTEKLDRLVERTGADRALCERLMLQFGPSFETVMELLDAHEAKVIDILCSQS